MKRVSNNLIMMAGMVALLSACGDMKRDPTTEYKDVSEGLVRPHNTKPRVQELRSSEIFDIFPADGQILNFVEGETKSYRIESRALSGIVYDVSLTGKPDDSMRLTKADKPGVYDLTWTAQPGHIPNGEPDRDHEITFELILLPSTDVRAQQIFNDPPIDRTRKHSVKVRRSRQQPVISKINGLKNTVNEGDKFSFTIEVNDPAAHAGNPPKLVPVEANGVNSELFEANGSSFVRLDTNNLQAKQTPEGSWVFHRVFDTKAAVIPLPLTKNGEVDASASTVTVRFGYMINGAGGLTSAEKVERVTINLDKKAEAPRIYFLTNKQSIGLETGVERDIEIGARVTNSRAKVSLNLEALRATISTWPGKPTISCEDSIRNLTEKNCVLSWKVPCNDASLKAEYPLTVEATSELFGRTETAKVTKTLKIVKKADNCRAAQAAAAKPAPSGASSPGGVQ